MTSPTDAGRSAREDFLAADRRTLVIAASAMVGLILVGVVSSSLFASPVCNRLSPQPMSPSPQAEADPSQLAAQPTDAGASTDAISALGTVFGTPTGAAGADGSDRLAVVSGGVAMLGDHAVVLDADGARVRAAATFDAATVRGSGEVIYALALVNELTGQVDALQPLDASLAALTCVETATVNTPLAFHLDAADGELLLLRTDEDGSEPQVQLRDASNGVVWETDMVLGQAPAGVLGARTTAALGESVIVGRRASTGDRDPALLALGLRDGEVLWQRRADELEGVFDEDVHRFLDVIAVHDDVAVVVVTDDVGDDGGGDSEVVTVSLDDGAVVERRDLSADAGRIVERRGELGITAASAVADIDGVGLIDVVGHDSGVTALIDVVDARIAVTFAG